MWSRSQVEQLTGVAKRKIQRLCDQNTNKDGLAFWRPAVSKPGYSEYDEADLLVFLLVGKFCAAGYALREIKPAFADMACSGEDFAQNLNAKREHLEKERARISAALEALGQIEAAAGLPGENHACVTDNFDALFFNEAARCLSDACMRALRQYPELADEAMRAIEAPDVDLSCLDAYEGVEDYVFDMFDHLKGSDAVAQVERLFTEFNGLYEAGYKADSVEMRAFLTDTARKQARARSGAETLFILHFMVLLLEYPFMRVFVECEFGNGASSYLMEAMQGAIRHFDELTPDSKILLAAGECERKDKQDAVWRVMREGEGLA